MTFNSQSPKPSRSALRLIARFYRFMGWLGLVGTVLIGIHALGDAWALANQPPDRTTIFYIPPLQQAIVNMAIFICLGLFLSGTAFLVSIFLEGGALMTVNSDKQTELLQRLVRDQGDDQTLTRLAEHEQPISENAASQEIRTQQGSKHLQTVSFK